MERYIPSAETDALLLKWWTILLDSGDLGEVFSGDLRAPSAFLALFQAPSALFFDTDDEGIRVAAWFSPALNGAMINLWARADFRHRQWLPIVIEMMRQVFTVSSIIMFITRGPQVLRVAEEVGFTALTPPIPTICVGHAGTFGFLTKETFEAKYGIRAVR